MLSLPPTPEKKESTPSASGGAASNAVTPTGSDGNAESAPPLAAALGAGVLVEGK